MYFRLGQIRFNLVNILPEYFSSFMKNFNFLIHYYFLHLLLIHNLLLRNYFPIHIKIYLQNNLYLFLLVSFRFLSLAKILGYFIIIINYNLRHLHTLNPIDNISNYLTLFIISFITN